MKRQIGFALFIVVAVTALLLISQSTTTAQGPGEPQVVEPAPLMAQVSSAFSYQGKLSNNGSLVNGTCDFQWNFYAAASGGTSLGGDINTGQPVVNGLFTVRIDVPASLINSAALFAEVQVRCPAGGGAYTILAPRQELLAAPYALGLRLPFAHTVNMTTAPVFSVANTSGSGTSPSILGSSFGSDGVRGLSTGAGSADNGVYGETNSTTSTEGAVKGVSTGTAAGGYFESTTGNGVVGATGSVSTFGGRFSNSAATTSGGAIYADGDAKQSLAGDGFVKAGVYTTCHATGSAITRFFNNVNTNAITVIDGGVGNPGRCTVDFGFEVRDNRYVTAMAYGGGIPRIVTFDPGSTTNRLDFFRFDENGVGKDGAIMIIIY